jgi:multiple sugar transport system permease protein
VKQGGLSGPVAVRGWRKAGLLAMFLAPSLAPLLLFTLVPMVASLWVSLHRWNLISPMKWTGLDNFREQLTDPDSRAAFLHTLAYLAGYLPLVYVGGLTLALGVNRRFRGRGPIRAAYFVPVVTSWVAVALVWKWLLEPDNGLVNYLLSLVGISGPGWWASSEWAIPSVILAAAWKDTGFVMVILLAGLQAIPQEYLDAARVDGAGTWRRFRHITLPLLSPSTFFVVVILLINNFQVFDQVYVMTGGGPAGSSEVIVQRVYNLSFRYGRVGAASALSWLLFAVIMLLTMTQVRLQRRWVVDYA